MKQQGQSRKGILNTNEASRILVGLANYGTEESTDHLSRLISPLGVDVFSGDEARNIEYELVCLTGEIPKVVPEEWEHTLAFQPSSKFNQLKDLTRKVDAVVLCEVEPSLVIMQFYESLLIPSLLNIDISDVVNISKGIGLSFRLSGKSGEEILRQLPKRSYFAKSALLHFSCAEDVTLKEVYDISKILAKDNNDPSKVRKINVKIGLRIGTTNAPEERIKLTAILFGI